MGNRSAVRFKCATLAAVAGGGGGAFLFWVIDMPSVWKWVVAGALAGLAIGVLWPELRSFAIRHRVEDWRLEEVDIQGLKFTSAGAQRRVAWRLFVEMVTRIATQTMRDEEGDDGVVLKSLHDLFQLTRQAISEVEPTPNATGDTLETFALDMLNSDLRPFLSKWHPEWDQFQKIANPPSQTWPSHEEFRTDLGQLQATILGRARGLALLAGVKKADRFFPAPLPNR